MGGNTHAVESLAQFAKEIAHNAGEKALTYYGQGDPNVRFDAELVTRCEIELTNHVEAQLRKHFPDHQLFMQNHPHHGYSHGENRYLWIFDPLDGSANFQAGIPIWGLSLALLENFWPIFGVFYLPAIGDMFHAQAGGRAFKGNDIIRISDNENLYDESLLFTYSRFHQRYNCNFPGKIRDLGCTGAHICYVAMGRGDAAVAANESYQDLAAPRIIVEAAGGKIMNIDGSDFFLNEYLNGHSTDGELIIGSPATCARIKECLIES